MGMLKIKEENLKVDILKIVGSSIASVIVLFILTKLMGKRQLSQLSMFDYINGITIGSIAAEMATSLEGDVWQPLVSMLIYAFFAIIISYASCKSLVLRKFFTGKPLILMKNGKLSKKNLKKAKLDLDEFLVQCRNSGYFDISNINVALLESNGKISFLPMSPQRPATPQDLNITVQQEEMQISLILDGKLLEENLKTMGKEEKWLQKKLNESGISKIEDVFLATCDYQDNFNAYPKDSDVN